MLMDPNNNTINVARYVTENRYSEKRYAYQVLLLTFAVYSNTGDFSLKTIVIVQSADFEM